MRTQTDTARVILDAGADYVLSVKGNQPRLCDKLQDLPWYEVAHTSTRSPGRTVTWTFKVLQCPSWVAFAGATQVAELRRCRTSQGKRTVEVVFLIASTSFEQAPPAILAQIVRGRWGIENRLHWVRDVTFDEDRSQVRTGICPQIMAFRNTAITLPRLAGHSNIAAALREHAYHPSATSKWLLTC